MLFLCRSLVHATPLAPPPPAQTRWHKQQGAARAAAVLMMVRANMRGSLADSGSNISKCNCSVESGAGVQAHNRRVTGPQGGYPASVYREPSRAVLLLTLAGTLRLLTLTARISSHSQLLLLRSFLGCSATASSRCGRTTSGSTIVVVVAVCLVGGPLVWVCALYASNRLDQREHTGRADRQTHMQPSGYPPKLVVYDSYG